MRVLTHIAGAAIAAIVALTAIPNDAAAVHADSFAFAATGDVTLFVGGVAVPNIVEGITSKEYGGGIVIHAGGGIFAGFDVGDIIPGPLAFNVPTDPPPFGTDIPDFSLTMDSFTFTFTRADLHTLVETGPADEGVLGADYYGTITGAPNPDWVGAPVLLAQACVQASLGGSISCTNVVEAVPEPASLAVLGSALAALGGFSLFRRRRARNAA